MDAVDAGEPGPRLCAEWPLLGPARRIRREPHGLLDLDRDQRRRQARAHHPHPRQRAAVQGGDTLFYSGDATDAEDGALAAAAFSWNIDFLHEGHVHPGLPQTGVKSGTFNIPTSGHDFNGNTRYRITLTVTDSDGLQASQSILVYPRKSA